MTAVRRCAVPLPSAQACVYAALCCVMAFMCSDCGETLAKLASDLGAAHAARNMTRNMEVRVIRSWVIARL